MILTLDFQKISLLLVLFRPAATSLTLWLYGNGFIKRATLLCLLQTCFTKITKPTITWCDLSFRFICIDATLLCEFESNIDMNQRV